MKGSLLRGCVDYEPCTLCKRRKPGGAFSIPLDRAVLQKPNGANRRCPDLSEPPRFAPGDAKTPTFQRLCPLP
jgi:hypothetical protein